MHVVGFATAVEIADLQNQGFEVEDAENYNLVGLSVEERGEGYLMAKPEAGPSGTKAVAIFIDAALYDVLMQLKHDDTARADAGDITIAFREVPPPVEGSMDVVQFAERKRTFLARAYALRDSAENHKYCTHKNPDGSDARYPTGNGETACICGNKWD